MSERVRVTVNSGDVDIVGEPRDGIDVEGARSTALDGEVVVKGGSDDVTVRVPSGTDVVVGSNSGNVRLRGLLGAVSVTTTSADVAAEDVASIDARTTSGRLEVEECRGSARLKAKSSRVHVGRVLGDVHASSVSGRVTVDEAGAGVTLTSVSGVIRVHVTGREPVRLETVSGKIEVTVPEGVRPSVRHRSVSGKARIDVDEGDDLEIGARLVSGSLRIGTR